MIIRPFPLPPPDYRPEFITRLLDAIRASFGDAVGKTEAVESVLLLSPGGKVWKLTVDDSGVLDTTEVPLGR